jgi:hypothetical protein
MSIILSLVGSRMSDDSLTREGYRQVVRISGKDLVRIFGTRRSWPQGLAQTKPIGAVGLNNPSDLHLQLLALAVSRRTPRALRNRPIRGAA